MLYILPPSHTHRITPDFHFSSLYGSLDFSLLMCFATSRTNLTDVRELSS